MKISVIICTRNRAYAILDCLNSVVSALNHAAPVQAEIVVVDNASTDKTSALVSEWSKTVPFPVQLQFEKIPGISNARNCGLRAAKGELLIFTDDDCRMADDYFRALLRHTSNDKELVLRGGRVELGNPDDLPITIKTSLTPEYWQKSLNSARHTNLGNCFPGCNMTMHRDVFNKIGFFDNRFGSKVLPASEDTDYTFRAYLAGIRIEYAPDIVIYHHHGRKKPEEGKRLMRNYLIATGALYVKHFGHDPNLCRQVYWDIKNFINEILSRKNGFMKDIDFSYRDRLACYFIGAFRYAQLAIMGARHP